MFRMHHVLFYTYYSATKKERGQEWHKWIHFDFGHNRRCFLGALNFKKPLQRWWPNKGKICFYLDCATKNTAVAILPPILTATEAAGVVLVQYELYQSKVVLVSPLDIYLVFGSAIHMKKTPHFLALNAGSWSWKRQGPLNATKIIGDCLGRQGLSIDTTLDHPPFLAGQYL